MSGWNRRAAVHASGGGMQRAHAVPARSVVTQLPSTRLDRSALARIQGTVASAPICFKLWDGFELPPLAGPAIGTIQFKNRLTLFGWLWDPDLNFGEAYMSGAVEIRGDRVPILEAIYRAAHASRRPSTFWKAAFDGPSSSSPPKLPVPSTRRASSTVPLGWVPRRPRSYGVAHEINAGKQQSRIESVRHSYER